MVVGYLDSTNAEAAVSAQPPESTRTAWRQSWLDMQAFAHANEF